MRNFFVAVICLSLISCWEKNQPPHDRVLGSKPIYSGRTEAKIISYTNTAVPVVLPGNIYVKGNLIYQFEAGKGIHVIDNTIPSQAHRIGFITVNGSSQISIKENYLYTNSYEDLVVIDISNSNSATEVKRMPGAFPAGINNYFYIEPTEPGYYQCPNGDSVVVGWKKGYVWTSDCYKN